MGHPFDGARAKLDRAENHLRGFEEEVRTFLGPNLYSIQSDRYPETRHYEFRVHFSRAVPHIRWGVLVGDIVHNIRCALDYVAWELAEAEGESMPNDRRTMFPLFIDPRLYERHGKPRIRRLGERAQTMVERLQPYRRENRYADPLWLLEELDSADKHKLLTVTLIAVKDGILTYHVPLKYRVDGTTFLIQGDIVEGANVGTLSFAEPPSGYPPMPQDSDVHVHIDLAIDVILRRSPDDPARYLALEFLRAMLRHARKIVALFSRHHDRTYLSRHPIVV
jgi:hypothetical protein